MDWFMLGYRRTRGREREAAGELEDGSLSETQSPTRDECREALWSMLSYGLVYQRRALRFLVDAYFRELFFLGA